MATSGEAAWLRTRERDKAVILAAGGAWKVAHLPGVDAALREFHPRRETPVIVDLKALEALDTAGAWLLHRTVRALQGQGIAIEYANVSPAHSVLLEQAAANDRPGEVEPERAGAVVEVLRRLGAGTVDAGREGAQLVGFLGLIVATLGRALVRPGRLRFTSLVYHMEHAGLNALPIVGLISFLIGVVLAYQGADQLRRFGAEVFVVNLIAISVLRELGILLTAIIVAGRSGSAFTAQIGSMKVNEEVDAMRTLGLDPIEVLVLPRLLALVLTLPLLAFFADMMALVGGGLMSWIALDISPWLFLERLSGAVTLWTFWVGIIKAPVFALVIAMVGCFEGMRVEGSAESVGRLTTRSVVESIFLVIVLDAAFSIFFATVRI